MTVPRKENGIKLGVANGVIFANDGINNFDQLRNSSYNPSSLIGIKYNQNPTQSRVDFDGNDNYNNILKYQFTQDAVNNFGNNATINPKVLSPFIKNNGLSGTNQLGAEEFGEKLANGESIDSGESSKPKFNGFSWGNEGTGQMVGGIASAAGTIGDAFLQQSFSDNQNTALSGAFSFGNEKVDEINGVNKSLNATDFGNLQGQYNNQNSILNGYKTKTLSKGQIGGMAGVGAAKGAAAGSAFGPYGAVFGAVAGAGAGLGKGLLANKKIRETNDAASFAQQGLNNSYLATAQNIRNINANNKKSDMFNNQAYYGANGGYLYANGGLMNPYGINVFNTGGKHSQNAFGGIPVSIAEDGKPNLVEEGEVLYDDYVYSDRIKINDTIRRKLKLKDSTKTFADAAKEVKERGDDRPNDPVTEHTIKAHMQILKSEQDKKKKQQEEKEQQKIIAQMNEQQLQAMQEQQMNQQANAYEQQMAQEQMAQQAQQEQMAMQEQQPAMPYAEGGKLKGGSNDIDAHRFDGENDWDSFEINGNRYNFKNKGDRSKGMWDYGYNDDGSDDEFYNYYSKIFKEGDDGYFTNDYTDYYNNAIEWARNLPEEEKEKFLEKYEPYYEQEFNGKKLEGSTDEKFEKFLGWASDNKWGNNHMILSDMYNHFNSQDEEVLEGETSAQQGKNKTNWMEYAPLGIDAYLAARSFAPVDYSRANAIMNTPISDIQYTPNGGKIAPYIIDPRLQQMANYSNAQATNRAIQNNSGGNGANAIAAMLANNYMANQNAANIGFQADTQNAAQIQAAQQFNNAVDAQNAQGFLQAASANQQADQVRGNFRADGLEMKDMLDSARGQAISNSMGALASDINNLNTYLYNKNWNAALAGSGYYGNLTSEGMRLAGITYQNIPQAQLDREAQVRMAQIQSDDNQRAIESQEAIVNAQLADAARQREWEEDYINRVNNQQ